MSGLIATVSLAAYGYLPWTLLGYVPFRDPLPIDRYWMWLLLPLVIGVALVYKAIKIRDLRKLPRQTVLLAGQIVVLMILAAAAVWLLTELV